MGITEFLNESYKIYGKPAPVVFENVKKTEWHLFSTTFVFNRYTAPYSWSPIEYKNEHFIHAQWCYINDLLTVRGYVFLNEVLDALGLERTKWGCLLGWTRKTNPNGIDFFIRAKDFSKDNIVLHFDDCVNIWNEL